ncbi:MAG TPA: hypothetical protein VNI77_09115 [Nitrososphaera sp.]|nr:hypothetical protein [Nitrososphaera sp.]
MDAYLEEEVYDLITYCIQNSQAADLSEKKNRAEESGRQLYADGGVDAMENMFFSIEQRIKEQIGQDARPYRAWWNGVSSEWKY